MDSPVVQNYGFWALVVTFFIVGLGTYFLRFAFYWFFRNRDFSENVRKILRFLPAAIFSALVFPQIFTSNIQAASFGEALLQNEKFLASLVAAIVGFITKSVFLTILVGMIVYWILIKFA